MKETELFEPVKLLFKEAGYKVNGEVLGCDVTCFKEDDCGNCEIAVVELKLRMSVELLAQANERQARADSVYVAIPRPKKFTTKGKWKNIFSLFKRLGIGLIFVDTDLSIASIIIKAKGDNDKRKNYKRREALIKEASLRTEECNVGGTLRTEIVTYYKEQCIYIACCLKRNKELKTSELRELGASKNCANMCRINYYGWFEKVGRCIYELTDKGYEDLQNFSKLTEKFEEKINEFERKINIDDEI